MKKFYTLFLFLLVYTIGNAQAIPVTFDSDIVVGSKNTGTIIPADANWFSDSGLESVAVVAAPDGSPFHGQVGQITSSTTGQPWQNAQLLMKTNYIDLTGTDKTVTFEHYSTVAGGGLLKLEQAAGGGGNIEKGFATSGMGWETISVDFTTPDLGAPTANDMYKLLVFFPGYGGGASQSDEVTYIDYITAPFEAIPNPLTSFSYDFATPTPFTTYNATFNDDAVNTVTDGINPTTEVGELSGVNDDWWSQLKYDVPQGVDLSTGDKGFSIKVKGPRALPVTLKVEGVQEHSVTVNYTTPDVWEELLFNFNDFTTNSNPKIALFFDIQVNGDVVTDPLLNIFQFDDFVFDVMNFSATCDDGIMNGNETDVDCGGPDCDACPGPTDAPTAPTHDEITDEVFSIYSDAYTDLEGTNFNPWWWQATIYSTETIASNNVIKYKNLNYQGINLGSADGNVPHDVSGLTYLHVDFWAYDSTTLNIFIIDQNLNGDNGEGSFALPITLGEWVRLDIPLTSFTGTEDLTDIHQLKFDGNGLVFVDNIYFHKGAPLSTNDFALSELKVYPNPSQDVWNIKTNNIVINAIQVYDILGNLVISKNPSSTQTEIDASRLSTGVYIAKVATEQGNSTFRLIRK